jgi:D-methionine transport system substrate-binding protein
MKRVIFIFTAAILLSCSSKSSKNELVFGFSPGPYSDLFHLAIKPGLEKRGYEIKTVEFTDWVTPNLALGNKETDANIFQHSRYLAQFSKDKGLALSPVIAIPTASLGLYSRKLKSIEEISPGLTITVPHDPTNLARALIFLQNLELITIKNDIDPTTASEKDILENRYNLAFTPVDAAQLPRTLESADLAVISGNYAISAGIRLSTALAGEKLELETENIVAVRTEDLDKPFVADLIEIIRSEEFKDVVEDPQYDFSGFQRPQWYVEQWQIENR